MQLQIVLCIPNEGERPSKHDKENAACKVAKQVAAAKIILLLLQILTNVEKVDCRR